MKKRVLAILIAAATLVMMSTVVMFAVSIPTVNITTGDGGYMDVYRWTTGQTFGDGTWVKDEENSGQSSFTENDDGQQPAPADTPGIIVTKQDDGSLIIEETNSGEKTKVVPVPADGKEFEGWGEIPEGKFTDSKDIKGTFKTKAVGVQTGDSNDIALFALMGVMALAGAGVVGLKKREN